jgi:dTDP-4-amino-4,6-dideoxygalactose transaminase
MKDTKIKFLDLRIEDEDEIDDLSKTFSAHLKSGQFIVDEAGEEFERSIAKFIGRKYGVGFGTGTDALTIGLRLLNIPAGSNILTTPFSWIASTTAILLSGLNPIYIDIGDDLQINLDLVDNFLRKSSSSVAAILVPHLHGNVSSLEHLSSLRNLHGIRIIEDCAQAFGARDKSNLLAGSIGDISTYSFNPMKVLGALGDAGAIVFDDVKYLERARRLRHSGLIGTKGLADELSTNCRIDAIQASFLQVRLKYFEREVSKRKLICQHYINELSEFIKPVTENIERSNHYCFQAICDERDSLLKYLSANGIEARVRHSALIPEHPILNIGAPDIPNARLLVDKTICLPMHAKLNNEDISRIIGSVKSFYRLGA